MSDTEWTKLEWTFDLSKYTQLTEDNISKTYIYIITTPQNTQQKIAAYYVDDFIMKSNKKGDGTFYDDYNLPAPAAGISSTATGETYFAADAVDVDTGIISLYAKYADKFKIGGTLANDIVTNSGTRKIKIYEKLFKKHFNTTASDGYFKMEEILKDKSNFDDLTEPKYTFEKADKVMQFCIDNGVEVIGHALIWDKENMFNIFEVMRMKALKKQDKELAMILKKISKMFRHLISWKEDMITLDEEMVFVNAFIDVQSYSMDDEVSVSINVDEEAKQCYIPKMSVQIFVENAFLHGLESIVNNKTFSLSAHIFDDRLIIEICDNGEGFKKELVEAINSGNIESYTENKGVGIKNVITRLKLYFDNEFTIYVSSVPYEKTQIKLDLPVKNQ